MADPALKVVPRSESPRPWPAQRRLPPSLSWATWDEVRPRLVDALHDAMEAGEWPIVLWGPVGTGKTAAAALCYAHWPSQVDVGRGQWASPRVPLHVDLTTFLTVAMSARATEHPPTVRRAWGVHWPTPADVVEADVPCTEARVTYRVERSELVVLDDLGVRRPSEAKLELLCQLVDARDRRPLIVTTNVNPADFRHLLDERLESRLRRGLLIHVGGDDRRAQTGRVVSV